MTSQKTKEQTPVASGPASRLRNAWRALAGDVPTAKPVAPKRGYRKELPKRREVEHINFDHESIQWIASIGRYADGTIGEVFLNSAKLAPQIEAMARDASVSFSIALQYGAPLHTVAEALNRDGLGNPLSPLGVVIDRIQLEVKAADASKS